MSHAATNWAIKQKGLKPATKIVLWHLCDRHNPDNGCFPSQANLAADCEMSRSTLNLHLSKLEAMGLITRIVSVDPKTKQQLPTRYVFDFESVSENRTGSVSEKQQKPCPKNEQSRVRKSDTNTVREPLREPVRAREGANDLFSENLPTVIERDPIEDQFEEFWKVYPNKKGKPSAKKAFAKAIKREAPEIIIRQAKKYAEWLKEPPGPGEFKPSPKFPQGWLNDDRWNDDVLKGPSSPVQSRYQEIIQNAQA